MDNDTFTPLLEQAPCEPTPTLVTELMGEDYLERTATEILRRISEDDLDTIETAEWLDDLRRRVIRKGMSRMFENALCNFLDEFSDEFSEYLEPDDITDWLNHFTY